MRRSAHHTVAAAASRKLHSHAKAPFVLQDACQGQAAGGRFAPLSRGFTIIEMIAVIAIIGILVSSLIFTFTKAKAQARQTDCKSNLRQFGVAVLIYRSDHSSQDPGWLSCLYPDYVDSKNLFVCRSDPAHGAGVCYPTDLAPLQTGYNTMQIADNAGNTSAGSSRNINISACSYFYEFSLAACPSTWGSYPSYQGYKDHQLQYGDQADGYAPYSTSRMPIIRCYHHIHEGHIRGYANQAAINAGTITDEKITLNVAYAGNVYVGPLWWEGTLQPGDTNNVTH